MAERGAHPVRSRARGTHPILRNVLIGLGSLLLVASGALCAEQVYIAAKKKMAGTLIADAYARHLEDGRVHRPWNWADFHPIAELSWIRTDGAIRESHIVLSGASGTSLAFGVGHVDGTSAPLASGNCVLAGHRTAEFQFLRRLRTGDTLRLSVRSRSCDYLVERVEIVPADDLGPLIDDGPGRLTLITCYPFEGWSTKTERYVVYCSGQASGEELPSARVGEVLRGAECGVVEESERREIRSG